MPDCTHWATSPPHGDPAPRDSALEAILEKQRQVRHIDFGDATRATRVASPRLGDSHALGSILRFRDTPLATRRLQARLKA